MSNLEIRIPVDPSGAINLEATAAFELARKLCDAAYVAQGGPTADPDERERQRRVREVRGASWFAELYCTILDIADDHHREALARGVDSAYGIELLDRQRTIDSIGRQVVEVIKDWDY